MLLDCYVIGNSRLLAVKFCGNQKLHTNLLLCEVSATRTHVLFKVHSTQVHPPIGKF